MKNGLPRRYFNLNIRHKDERWRASTFLTDAARPRAPVFYGRRTIDELRLSAVEASGLRRKEWKEAQRFLNLVCHARGAFQPVIVTIDEGRVWIYEPTGDPREYEAIPGFSGEPDGILVKAYQVSHLADRQGVPVSDVPLILSSMKANQAFCRNTFTEIGGSGVGRYGGNIAAIKAVLGEVDAGFGVDPLDCLSAVEFETLVAKLFEAQGCFVPAYRGGVMKDVDLYVHTEGAEDNGLFQLPQGQVISVQLKLSAKADMRTLAQWVRADRRHFLVSLDDRPCDSLGSCRERWITRHDIRQWVGRVPSVRAWLDRSLRWLPAEWRKAEGASMSPHPANELASA